MILGGAPNNRVENIFHKCQDYPIRIARSNETKIDSSDSKTCRALPSSTLGCEQGTSYYTLEIVCFSPRLCASRSPCSCVASMGDSELPAGTSERVSPGVPLWKTLRRNSSRLKGNRLYAADSEVTAETSAYLVADKNDGETSSSHCSSGSESDCCGVPCCVKSADSCMCCRVIEVFDHRPIYFINELVSSPLLNHQQRVSCLIPERDFCNSQSSPENVKMAENMLLKSPKQKPKKSTKSSKENKKKLPKYLTPPERDSFLIKSPIQEKAQGDKVSASPKLSPESVKSKTKKSSKKKQNNSTSLSLRTVTAEHTQANAHSTNSSDTVAIAVNNVNAPKTKHGDDVAASSDTSPKAKQFSEEAEKMLSITKRTVCHLAACSQDDRSTASSSSNKSCRSAEDNSDTKPSVSSFSASQLPAERKSSMATNATQELSLKLTEELAENVEASPTSSEGESTPSSIASHRDVTAPSSPRREDRDEASPTELLETGSNFMTKISDVSGSFISTTLSSTHTRKHGRHTLGSTLHKRTTVEGSIGSKKFRRPRAYGQNSECRTSPSPHKKAVRSVSCPMNPMTTPEYIEATKNTVIGSSSSFLEALRGQRSWVPNVVTWFQGLFNRERDTSRMSSLVTSKDDNEAPKIDRLSPCLVRVESRQSGQEDSFSSIVLDKLRPTGRWATAKVSTLFRLDESSRERRDVGAIPALTSASCMICPPEDEGPCPFSSQDDFDCDDMPPLNPKVTRNKTPPILKSKIEKDKKPPGRGSRRKALDTENPASLIEDQRQKKTPPKSSPSKKPCYWQQSPKKSDSDAVSKQRRDGKKSSLPQCIWEVPEPPPTDQEESSDVCGKVTNNDPGSGCLDGTPLHMKDKMRIEEAEPFVPNAMESYFVEEEHERYSIASLDYEGIGDIDERPNKQEEKNRVDLVNWSGFLSPSIASFAMSAAGNTIWSQLEKIREANIKYQFPQRRGLYEPPKAYPIWMYADHIQKFLNFFGKRTDADDQKDASRARRPSENEPKKSSFDENAARLAEELRQAKEKEARRDSTSSWASNVTAQPKVEEPVHFPQTVDNFRELRLCYPSLPLPLNRHTMHQFCHQHCCYLHRLPSRHQTHKCQSFATCSQCPTHGATFRRRSTSPRTPTSQGEHDCCLYRVCPRPLPLLCSPRCCRQRRPRLPRCSSSRKEIRRMSSCPVKPKTTPWATCCAKVMKMIHCDAFSQSELKRKSCLLSEKGDRYYYKNLFRKRINMRNFMKEMKKASTVNVLSPENITAEASDEGEGRFSPPVKCPEKCASEEKQFDKTDYHQEGNDSPCGSKLNNYTIASLSPCKEMVNNYTVPGVTPCKEILKNYSVSPCKEMFNSIRLSCTPMCNYLTACKTDTVEDKMDQSKNKCDAYDSETIYAAEKYQRFTSTGYNDSWETTEKAKFNIKASHENVKDNWDTSKLMSKLTNPFHPLNTDKLNVSSMKQFSMSNSCAPQPRRDTSEENIFQCPCGINFVHPCSAQRELAFNRKKEHLVSRIKSGNIEPTGNQVLPFAGPYRYEDLHTPMSQLKVERYKTKNDFRHSSFLYEDVLRDKFIPSRDQDEGCLSRRLPEFKRPASKRENSPLKAEQVAQDVLATLPRVSYKPPIYRRGQESQCSSSRRYDTCYNRFMGRNANFQRAANENAAGMSRNYGDGVDVAWKPVPAATESSDVNSSNLFMGRQRDNVLPDGLITGRSCNIADIKVSSRMLSYHHNYVSAQTASLLHGATHYGNLLSSDSKSNVFIIRQRDNVLPGRACNIADLNVTSSNASRLMPANYSNISAQTASLLHGASNYSNLMNSTSNSVFPLDFNKKAAPCSLKTGMGYNLNAPVHYNPPSFSCGLQTTYNSRMPFPYNHAEKVLMTSSFHPPNTVKCSRRRFY